MQSAQEDTAAVNMAEDLLGRAKQLRQKLHENVHFVASDIDHELVITELQFALWAARLRRNVDALMVGLQSFRSIIGINPDLLWSQGFQLHGELPVCIKGVLWQQSLEGHPDKAALQ